MENKLIIIILALECIYFMTAVFERILKNRQEKKVDESFFDEDEEEPIDLSFLRKTDLNDNSIRELDTYFSHKFFVKENIINKSYYKDILSNAERDAAVNLIAAYIGYLKNYVEIEEQTFESLLLMLVNSDDRGYESGCKNAVEMLFEDELKSSFNRWHDFNKEYMAYKLANVNHNKVVLACMAIIIELIQDIKNDADDYNFKISDVLFGKEEKS